MNILLTPDEAAKRIHKIFKDSGIFEKMEKASPKDQKIMWHMICNMFGGGFPK